MDSDSDEQFWDKCCRMIVTWQLAFETTNLASYTGRLEDENLKHFRSLQGRYLMTSLDAHVHQVR